MPRKRKITKVELYQQALDGAPGALKYLIESYTKDPHGPPLCSARVGAAKTVLAKVLPDIRAVEVSGDVDTKIVHRIEFV